jgi:hypothetical protein
MDRSYMRDNVSTGRWLEMMIGRNIIWPGGIALMILIARRRILTFALPLTTIAYFWGIHTLTVAEVRFSEPLHPLLAVLIVAAFAPLPKPSDSTDQG